MAVLHGKNMCLNNKSFIGVKTGTCYIHGHLDTLRTLCTSMVHLWQSQTDYISFHHLSLEAHVTLLWLQLLIISAHHH